MGSLVITVLAAAIVTVQMSSCTKTTAQTNTCPTELTKVQILTQKTWRIAQLQHVISGVYSSYTYGGTNTTGINYDLMRFTFNADSTGTLIDQNGISYTTTWQFTTADQRTLQLNLSNGASYSWQMIQIAGNYMNVSEPLTISGNPNNLESYQLIQIP